VSNNPVSGEDSQLEIATDFLIRDPIFLPSDNYQRIRNYFPLGRVTHSDTLNLFPLCQLCSYTKFQSGESVAIFFIVLYSSKIIEIISEDTCNHVLQYQVFFSLARKIVPACMIEFV
jgi:hypothetical protein